MLDDVVLDEQIRNNKLEIVVSMLDEAFIVGLPTTLRMKDRPIQYHAVERTLALKSTLRSLKNILNCRITFELKQKLSLKSVFLSIPCRSHRSSP